jgi:glucose/arabinose dehydrogenase
MVSARLSRFTVSGSTISGPETVMIEDWCQQFPSHSIGSLAFGPDGALYVGGGDGASFTVIDYGQLGGTLSGTPTPRNPCADPPGGAMTPPSAAGGALRSQDARSGSTSAAYASLVAADGAVAHWRLGEASGTTVTDVIGGNNGTYVGAPVKGQLGALNGDPDTAVRFPSIADYVSIPDRNALDFGNGPFSIEFWYKASTPNTIRYIISKANQFNVYMNPTGNLTVDNDNTAAVQVGAGKGIGADTTNWHHYVITRTGSGPTGTRIFQDGVDVTNFASDQTFSSNAFPMYLGSYYNKSFPILGTLDEVALYRTALSPAQVNSHYAAAYPATSTDPTGLNGAILRVDPVTGAAMPDNPMAGSGDPNQRRIIAYGLRNPFRFTIRPGTNELWLGDVGAGTFEEIDRIASIGDGTVENFGWPCYEGTPRNSGYDDANVSTCENLYAEGASAVTAPVFYYDHAAQVVTGESCPTGSSAIAGMAFYPETGGSFPAAYRGGLFFADHNRSCIWFIPKGTNGQPDPAQRQTFATAANPVDLEIGPNGDLFYVDFDTSTIRRISATGTNQPPTARIIATPQSGPAPLTVNFDGTTSTDPEGGALVYDWDLDGNGTYGDSASPTPSRTYSTQGTVTVGLHVIDPGGAMGPTTKVITIGPPNALPVPVISTPVSGTTWKVGDQISFTGSATDTEDGTLAPSKLSWTLVLQHCPSNCHPHALEAFPGVASGSFFTPDHDYPSYLELTLTATDSAGGTASVTRRLDPKTVSLSFQTAPTGLSLTVGGVVSTTPFSRTVIQGSNNSLSAPSPQSLAGQAYAFQSWSDGGQATHNVTASAAASYTATYTPTATVSYAQTVLQDAPVAYWRLGEASGTAAADSAGANTGTYNGSPTLGIPGALTGDANTAMTVDGVNDSVAVPDAAPLHLGDGPWSMELWYKRASLSTNGYILTKGGGTARPYLDYDGQIYVTVLGIGDAVSAAGPRDVGVWHHLVITKSAADVWKVYIDGVDRTVPIGALSTVSNSAGLTVGGTAWSGALDEVAMYATELSAARVQAHYTAARGGP